MDVKKVLKCEDIKFQIHYTAKMWVFYYKCARLYQDGAEAKRDMATRGFPVTVVMSAAASDHEEM